MKVITLTQPWATLIAAGHKKLETRSWRPFYTGPIAIHAAKGWKAEDRELIGDEPFRSALIDAADQGLMPPGGLPPRGAIIAIAYLSGCYRTPAYGERITHKGGLVLPPAEPEYSFGNFAPDRWVWVLGNVRPIQPIPMRGSLGLWTWDGTPTPKPILQDSTARLGLCVCGKPAAIRCARCGRGDCGKHIEDQPKDGPICFPCGARAKLARLSTPEHLRAEARSAALLSAITHRPFAADGNSPAECDFCGGLGITGSVSCIWCGGTGKHVPPIQTRTGTEG